MALSESKQTLEVHPVANASMSRARRRWSRRDWCFISYGVGLGLSLVVFVAWVLSPLLGVPPGRETDWLMPWNWDVWNETAASWFGAIGTLLALAVAIWAPARSDAKRDEREVRALVREEEQRKELARARATGLVPELIELRRQIRMRGRMWRRFNKLAETAAPGTLVKGFVELARQTRLSLPRTVLLLLERPSDLGPAEGQSQVIQLAAMIELANRTLSEQEVRASGYPAKEIIKVGRGHFRWFASMYLSLMKAQELVGAAAEWNTRPMLAGREQAIRKAATGGI